MTVNIEQVLADINAIRRELGMSEITKLPTGNRGRSSSCPIAIALAGTDPSGNRVHTLVGADSLHIGVMAPYCRADGKFAREVERDLTPALLEFRRQFDAGDFSEYLRKF